MSIPITVIMVKLYGLVFLLLWATFFFREFGGFQFEKAAALVNVKQKRQQQQ